RQRPNGVRRYPRQGTPLPRRLCCPGEVKPLQVPEPSMDGAQVIERGAAPEVFALDQRDGEPTLRGVAGDGEAVNAPSDDEDVERRTGERVDVSLHRGERSGEAIRAAISFQQ